MFKKYNFRNTINKSKTYGTESSEKQNILLQHMHKKEFGILTNKCGNNPKYENEAEEPWLFSLVFEFKIISTFIGENPKFFFMHFLKKDVLLL